MAALLTWIQEFVRAQYDQLNDAFTDKEAWVLFRTAAYLETFGWTLLISAIIYKHFRLPAYEFVLPISGTLHGVFFLVYILIVFFVHRSLRWGFKQFIFAEVIVNLPYAALVYELIVARIRSRRRLKR